ncbi:MAG: protein-glutamate O-methyltransferase [Pseudomonadota bacterium]
MREFRQIAAFIHSEAGISLPDSKRSLVYSRLTKRLRALKLQSFKDYCDVIEDHTNQDERRELLSALTTNVTNFYREPHHFEDLKSNVAPRLIEKAKAGGRVRVWSAACSSGQEPYTIALTFLSLAKNIADYDFRILATDIDPAIVQTAKNAQYHQSLLTNVPKKELSSFFNQTGDDIYQPNDSVRSLVSFKEMNLIADWPVKGPFDVIFCRNVVIYFDTETEETVWGKFADKLADGGHLYIGHSERITGPATNVLTPSGVTAYTKNASLTVR